jgi:Meckel syndrome type 1 protein
MSKSNCDSSVPPHASQSQESWYSVYYEFDKDGFRFLVDNVITGYSAKLKKLSNVINANANGDNSVFEHIEYILSKKSDREDVWNRFQTLLECLIILDQIHDVHLSNRLCSTYPNYNAAEGKGCYELNSLITLLRNKAGNINITVSYSGDINTLKEPFIEYLKGLRVNILHQLNPNESSSKIPNGIYVIRDTKSKGKAKEEVLIKTDEKIDTIASLTDSHSCKSNGNFKITDTITSISEIDILNLGLLYYQSYFSNLTYRDYRISIHFDISQGSQQIACNGSFKLCIKLWNKVPGKSTYNNLDTKEIEISSNVFSVKNICETLTKKNTADKIAIELRAFFQQHDLDDDVIGIFLMNIFMIGKGYGDYGQGFTAGCAYMYKEAGIVTPLYCNCFVETVDTFFFLICVLCIFPAIIGTVGNNWQYVILNDSQRFLGQNVIEMFNANSKIKVIGIDADGGNIKSHENKYATLTFYDSNNDIATAFSEIKSETFFAYEEELPALEESRANRERRILVSRPSESKKENSSYPYLHAALKHSQSQIKPPPPPQIKASYINKLEALISGNEDENKDLNLTAVTTSLTNISIDDIIKKGVKLAMAKFFTLRMIKFNSGEISYTSYFLFYENGSEKYPIFWDGKLLEYVEPSTTYPSTKIGNYADGITNMQVYEFYRKVASEVDTNTFAFMVMVYVFLNQYKGFPQYRDFINMVKTIKLESSTSVNKCSGKKAAKISGNKGSKNFNPAVQLQENKREGPEIDQIELSKIEEFERNFKSSLRTLTDEIKTDLKSIMEKTMLDDSTSYFNLFSLTTTSAVKKLLQQAPNFLDSDKLIELLERKGGNIVYFQFDASANVGGKRKISKGELDVLKTVVCKITSICDNIEEYCNILDRILKNIRELTNIKNKILETIKHLNTLIYQRRRDPYLVAIYNERIHYLQDFSIRQLDNLLRYYNALFNGYYDDYQAILNITDYFKAYFAVGGWWAGDATQQDINELVKDINGKVSATQIDCGKCNTECRFPDGSSYDESPPSKRRKHTGGTNEQIKKNFIKKGKTLKKLIETFEGLEDEEDIETIYNIFIQLIVTMSDINLNTLNAVHSMNYVSNIKAEFQSLQEVKANLRINFNKILKSKLQLQKFSNYFGMKNEAISRSPSANIFETDQGEVRLYIDSIDNNIDEHEEILQSLTDSYPLGDDNKECDIVTCNKTENESNNENCDMEEEQAVAQQAVAQQAVAQQYLVDRQVAEEQSDDILPNIFEGDAHFTLSEEERRTAAQLFTEGQGLGASMNMEEVPSNEGAGATSEQSEQSKQMREILLASSIAPNQYVEGSQSAQKASAMSPTSPKGSSSSLFGGNKKNLYNKKIPKTAPASKPKTAPASKPKTAPVSKPKTAPASKPKTAPASKPKTAPVSKPKTAPASKPKTAPASKPKTAPASKPKIVKETKPKTAPASKPKTAPASKPKIVKETKPKTAPASKPKTAPASKPKTAPVSKPKTAPASKPKTAPASKPKIVKETKPKTAPASKPKTAPASKPKIVKETKPKTAPASKPKTAPASKPKIVKETKPKTAPASKPKIAPASKPKTAPASKPKIAPASKPKTAPASKPKIAPASKPKTAPASKPKTAPASKPKTAPASKPKIAPVSKPKTAPASKPKTAPASKPKIAPVSKPKTAPASKPKTAPASKSKVPKTESKKQKKVSLI